MRGCLAATVAIVLGSSVPAFGQVTAVGAKGGVHWADFTDDLRGLETNTRTTWGAGGFIQVGLTEVIRLQPELLWVGKGAEVETGNPDVGEAEIDLSYIEVPVLVRFDLWGRGWSVRPYVMLGPYVAFELSCEVEGGFDGVDVEVDCDNALVDFPTNSPTFGLLAAVGVEVPVGGLASVLLEGRFSQGITDVNDDGVGDTGDDVRNRVFALYAGVSVPWGP